MTSREIILANLNHQNPERMGLTFDGGRINDMVMGGPGDPIGYKQRRWIEGNREFYDDSWGNIWVRMKDGSVKGEIHRPVIEEWSDLDHYEAPRYDVDKSAALMRAAFDREPGKFRTAPIGGWIFDNARYLRKLEIYLMDMALYPAELKRMHAMVVGVYENKIHAAGKAGADAVFIGEDMGTQLGLLFSPEMFREYFSADYTRLFGLAHDYGMKVLMHSCGQNRQILPDLLKAGVNCFQFDQPALYDMEDLAELFKKHRAALWSPVDIQKILPTGDRGLIEAGAKEMAGLFRGFLITKNYPDLPGIGVKEEWDRWAYDALCEEAGVPLSDR